MKELYADKFPISARKLAMKDMGIQKIVGSFDDLENLQELSLAHNQFTKINPIRLPITSLRILDVSNCDLQLISPFLKSILEENNKDINL